MQELRELRKFAQVDIEKRDLLHNLLASSKILLCEKELKAEFDTVNYDMAYSDEAYDLCESPLPEHFRYCPECGRRFSEDENFCSDCLVRLKRQKDGIDIMSIATSPVLVYEGKNDYPSILTDECIEKIIDFDFTIDDFKDILFSIKSQGFKNLDKLIKDNSIRLDELDILYKVILFTKSFVGVEYKSYGSTLGYFELNRIHVDDRQRDSLQITTLIHELTHFLIKEILIAATCRVLDATKNAHIEAVITYILNYSRFNELIDEYAAHSVEGRFTVFGYQDYSSFIALQGDLDEEHVEMAKIIGNTFSIYIKDLLEGFLDSDLRSEIKEQFLSDTIEGPDYGQLRFENCNKLSDEGFIKAIGLILSDIESVDAGKIRDLESEIMNECHIN